MHLDPWNLFILCLTAIAWCVWGILFAHQCYSPTYSWQWRVVIIAYAGPCIWIIALWRTILLARRAIMRRFGVENCHCCGGRHHD